MSPRKAVKQELTREMIMNVARELFIAQGYQHTSMRKIATELGYSHGSIYYHFKKQKQSYFTPMGGNRDFHLIKPKRFRNKFGYSKVYPKEEAKLKKRGFNSGFSFGILGSLKKIQEVIYETLWFFKSKRIAEIKKRCFGQNKSLNCLSLLEKNFCGKGFILPSL
ncbi:Transcriptional regulator, TetR family [Bacillus thuringiensis serovar israelensis ATCC 35646]|nr:Transcriptional regulator, TetR family [Bacillus thuringiensis serovar israelensis ATCC 35646]